MLPERIRKRVIEEWRGLPDLPPRPDRCVAAADALKKLLPRLGLSERINEHEVQTTWRDIVGSFIASHSVPVSIRHGVLSIQVLQPTIRYELDRSWKVEILRKLQSQFGPKVIRDVQFRG